MPSFGEEKDQGKFNAGIDAQKRVMDLFRDIDRMSLGKNGQAQETKHVLVKQLCLATRGLFNKPEVRNNIWSAFNEIQLTRQNVTVRQGKSQLQIVYDNKVDEQLDALVMIITDYLQDEKGFFSPEGAEAGL